MSNDQNDQPVTNPEYKLVLDLACAEMHYRRKKQWDIFAWVVTILVSVIGGIIVLTSKDKITPDLLSRLAMSGALAALTFYAYFWINENIDAETHAYNKITNLLGEQTAATIIKKPCDFWFGYAFVVALIGIGAVVTVAFVNVFPGWGILKGP